MRWPLPFALLGASIIPLLIAEFIPLHDFPSHLARMHILVGFDDQPAFARAYVRQSLLLPNIAYDAVVLALAPVMPVEAASRVFLAITILMCGLGVACLQWVLFGELTLSVFLGIMLVFNGILRWGFINYVFGVGLMLVAFAGWIALEHRSIRLAVGTAASLALLFSHLTAFGLYGLVVLGWELEGLLRRRWTLARVAVSCLQFVPALAAFVLMRTGEAGSYMLLWVENPAEKLKFLVSSVTTFVLPADFLFGLAVLLVALLAVARRLEVAVHPRLWFPLGLVLLSFLALPHALLGSIYLDTRIPIAFFLLLAGGTRIVATADGPRRFAMAALGIACALRISAIAAAWVGYDRDFRSLDFSGLGPGDVLFTFPGPLRGTADWLREWGPPMTHAAAYATTSGAFVPLVFADPRHQPISVRQEFASLNQVQSAIWKWGERADVEGVVDRVVDKIRSESLSSRTFLLLLRCHNLVLRPNPAYAVVFAHERVCLLRLAPRGTASG